MKRTAQQSTRQVDARQHRRQQPLERNNVTLAIIQQTITLGLGKRSAADGDVPHLVLFGGADAVEPEIRQRADQASAGGCRKAIGTVAKLDEEIENVGRLQASLANLKQPSSALA